MGALYRRQGKYEAAETLEDAALRAKKQVRSYEKQFCNLAKNLLALENNIVAFGCVSVSYHGVMD